MQKYPGLKMFNLFEYSKFEDQTMRDFRISVNDAIRAEFLKDFAAVKDRYIFANATSNAITPAVGDKQEEIGIANGEAAKEIDGSSKKNNDFGSGANKFEAHQSFFLIGVLASLI